LVEQPIRNRQVIGSSPIVGSSIHAVKPEFGMVSLSHPVSHKIQGSAGHRDLTAFPFGSMSVIAFHEPVGVKSILRFSTRCFTLPSRHCRHASIRTLEERFVSLGAHWAFSIQPVLRSVWRPWFCSGRVEPGPGD
jgi:hypothetical protein